VRLFVAVWPDDATRRALDGLGVRRAAGLRVVPPDQWHVTLRFLGEVDPAIVPEVTTTLASAAAGSAAVVARVGPATGWLGRGAVLYVPVGGLEPLAARVRAESAAVVPLSPADEAPFTGHLTLARANRRRRLPAEARRALAGAELAAEFAVEAIDLVESVLGSGGPRYHVRARIPLGAGG